MLTFKNKLKTLSVEQLEQLTAHLNKIEDNLIAVLDLVDVEIISDHVGYSFSMVQDTITELMYDSNCALSDKTEGNDRLVINYKVYLDGKKAFEMGAQTVNNPYKYGTDEYHSWDAGYESAKYELYGR